MDVEIPLPLLTDVILRVLVPGGLVRCKRVEMDVPLTLPKGLPFSSIRVSLTPEKIGRREVIAKFHVWPLYLQYDGEFAAGEVYHLQPRIH